MTRADRRAQCIEAIGDEIADALNYDWPKINALAARILDSLHGIAFIDPIEATEEMRTAAAPHFCGACKAYKTDEEAWRAMAAAGDLTNPTERKP